MSLSFPLSASAFFEKLKLASFTFPPSRGQESSTAGSGEIIFKDTRPMLWSVPGATTSDLDFAEFARVRALVQAIQERQGSFYAYDITKPYPAADPTGSVFGASTPVVADLSGRYGVKVSGLPPGYVLTTGDYFALNDGTSQMLHEIEEDVTADGSGVAGFFDVHPKTSLATEAGQAIVLIKPLVEMAIVPGSIKYQDGSGPMTRILAFDTIQVRH